MIKMGSRGYVLMLLALWASLGAVAAYSESKCADPKSHEFDFWIGDWEVFADGDLAGRNKIEPILDGCVLQETWQGKGGSAGSSFNFFNPQTKKWQQFWVWRNGTTLELEGDYRDGKVLLKGTSQDRSGNTVLNRISWFDYPDGSVRQLWESSSDSGKTWKVAFDGLYRKQPTSP